MKSKIPPRFAVVEKTAVLLLAVFAAGQPSLLSAKDKTPPVDPNDVTFRLFQLLDDSHGGKLDDFYVLADIYKDKDPANADGELQHVLRVEYDKNRMFGKLNIHVRCMAKLAPEQLKTYTLKQIYDFGADDSEKFVKSEPGELGKAGDMFLRATGDRPPASTPITDDARKEYEFFLTQYILPALQKK
jgi:hypothetical protein